MSEVAAARSLDNYRDQCRVCGRRVLRCFDGDGRAISVESVEFGRGRLAITRDLVDARLVAQVVAQATSYRKHGCPAADAFSASSFGKKGGRA